MNIGFQTPIRLDAQPAERSLDLRTYINFLWRHWMFIGAVVALALLVALIYLARTTPMYTATAQILVDPQREKTASVSDLMDVYAYSNLDNQVTIIKSDPLLQRVVIKERLAPPPPVSANAPQSTSQSPPDKDAKSAEAQRIQDAVNRLRGALSARRIAETNAFDISVTWVDPERAAQL